MGTQPIMAPRFLGRSARSLISIAYRLEAWQLKIVYCRHLLYGPAQFVGHTINSQCLCTAHHQEQLTVVLRSHCCTALSLLTSDRVLLPAVVSRVFPPRECS
jgi:hypothetical protein